MSSNEPKRLSKRFRTLCASCQERKARFRYQGEVRADRDHTLCFECHRGEINRARARWLAEGATMPSLFERQKAVNGRVLDLQQLSHRRRMFDHLQPTSAAAS